MITDSKKQHYLAVKKYNHGQKSMKVPFVTYADLESYLKEQVLVIIILKNHQQPK